MLLVHLNAKKQSQVLRSSEWRWRHQGVNFSIYITKTIRFLLNVDQAERSVLGDIFCVLRERNKLKNVCCICTRVPKNMQMVKVKDSSSYINVSEKYIEFFEVFSFWNIRNMSPPKKEKKRSLSFVLAEIRLCVHSAERSKCAWLGSKFRKGLIHFLS